MNNNMPSWNVWTWPNAITIGRLVLGVFGALHALEVINLGNIFTPLFTSSAEVFARYNVAVGGSLITIAITGDALDGYIARKTNSISRFGEFVDPLVDKLLFWIAVGVIFIVQTTFPRWFSCWRQVCCSSASCSMIFGPLIIILIIPVVPSQAGK
jgi:phosphatidylglycerophosphate synthase